MDEGAQLTCATGSVTARTGDMFDDFHGQRVTIIGFRDAYGEVAVSCRSENGLQELSEATAAACLLMKRDGRPRDGRGNFWKRGPLGVPPHPLERE